MSDATHEVTTTPSSQHPIDFCETLLHKHCALKAYAALIGSARLTDFDPNECKLQPYKSEVQSLQYGLQMLLDLYIADQEQTIENFQRQYEDNDEYLLGSAARTLGLAERGAWADGHLPADPFNRAMAALQTIIARGGSLRPVAETMIEALGKYAPPKSRKAAREVE